MANYKKSIRLRKEEPAIEIARLRMEIRIKQHQLMKLRRAAEDLLEIYVANRGKPEHSFVSCITPKGNRLHESSTGRRWMDLQDAVSAVEAS